MSIASNFTAISGVSASITPSSSSSQILVFVRGHIYQDTNDTTGGVTIYRNGVNVSNGTYGLSAFYGYFGTNPGNVDFVYPVDIKYLDSPSTTSSVTYALYYKSDQAVGWNTVRGSETSIILMEIAA